MELRHLRYFAAVASHGSVAEAARHLNIVQPALSRQIRSLEEELSANLFVRDSRGMVLTAAGEQFLKDTRRVLAELAAAGQRAARLSAPQLQSLRIGVTPIYTCHPVISTALYTYRTAYPEVQLQLEPVVSLKQFDLIRECKLEGGFSPWRDRAATDLRGVTAFRCGTLLAVPRSGRWASAAPQQLSALYDEPCIWFPRARSPGYFDFLAEQFRIARFAPELLTIGTDHASILGMVAAGMGYSIVPESTKFNCPREVVLHEHPDLATPYEVEFVWRNGAETPELEHFIDFVRRTTQDAEAGAAMV